MWQTCRTFATLSSTSTLLLKSTHPHFSHCSKVFPEHRCYIWINSVLNANSHASVAKLTDGRNSALSFVQSCICKIFVRCISGVFQQFAGDKAVTGKTMACWEKKLLRRIINKSIQGRWLKALVENTCIFLPYKIAVLCSWRKHPNCFCFSSFAYFGKKGAAVKPSLAPSACSTIQTPAHKPAPLCKHTFNSFDKNLFLFTGVFFFY